MKRTEKDFRQYVSTIRKSIPEYNHGRKVIVLGEDTKRGQEIIAMGSRWDGNDLHQVYDSWSQAKEYAFNEAWEMYCNAPNSDSFGICSHNSFGFTVSFLSDNGLTVLTPKTEYLVIFNE